MKLLDWYNKTEDPKLLCQNAKLASTETCGGLAVAAGIIGWNYMHNLGKMEEKKKMVKQHYTLMTSQKGKGWPE